MTDRILLVCDANVCRSPYAESVLKSLLSAAGMQRISVGSAGLDVAPGHPMCAEAAARLAEREANGVAHRARSLQAGDIESANLVLVAERRHRAAIARLSPMASARTFTMREAAALGAASRLSSAPVASGASVEAFAARIHEARGLVGPIELDIVDGHHGSLRQHHRTLDEVGAAASAIARSLLGA
jgi:protein-tyrosine phosphatase